MNWLGYLYLALVTIVMIYLILRYIDLTSKVKRQRRRYDLLLKGRGELNLEELLKAHSHDIDLAIKKLKTLEENYTNFDENLESNKSYLDKKILEINSNTSTSLLDRSDRQFGDLDQKLVNFNSTLDKKVDSVNSTLNKKIESSFSRLNTDLGKSNSDINNKITRLDADMNSKLKSLDDLYNNRVNKLDSDLNSKLKNLDDLYNNRVNKLNSDFNTNLKSLDDQYNTRVNNVDSKFTNEVEKINADRATQYKKINERHEFDVSSLKKLDEENYNKLVEFINKQDKALDDNLAFAIQQVSLHKYNALHNQSGDLSFTMVLLDRMKNGLMLTSINGRDASYTYSKEIVNGKCLVDISPEEEKALNMLVKNN